MDYSLLLKELPRFDTGDVEPILNNLLARQVDGLIWAVPEVGDNRAWLQNRLPGLPVPIIFLTMRPRTGLSVAAIDNYAGGRLAAAHLLDQGYRHIAHLAGPLAWWEARQRKAGWADVLAEASLPVDDRQWVEGNWSSRSGEQAFRQLLEQYPDLDAVFVANDQMALGVLQVACRRGLNVPRDLGVVGFDGIPESAYFWPPLTTIHQDLYQLGCTAVKQVVQAIEASRDSDKDDNVQDGQIEPRLIVRESSISRKGGMSIETN
jgi:LacI family transcriptional regulator